MRLAQGEKPGGFERKYQGSPSMQLMAWINDVLKLRMSPDQVRTINPTKNARANAWNGYIIPILEV